MTNVVTAAGGAAKRISRARTQLMLRYPFYATLAVHLEPWESKSCPTMGTDGRYLMYNPDFVAKLNHDELLGVIVHECLHCVFLHPGKRRTGGRDPLIWNIAADYLVNYMILEQEHLTLPKGCLVPPRGFVQDATTTEEVYDRIIQNAQKMPMSGGKGKGKGKGQKDDGGSSQGESIPERGASDDDHSAWGKSKGYGTREGDEEAKANAAGDTEAGFDENEWKDLTRRAAAAARMQGKLPGFMEAAIQDTLNPPMDWRVILHDWVEALIKTNYRLSPPNKRYLWMPLIMPSLQIEDDGRVEGVVVIDTSGSIGDPEIAEFVGNIKGITEQFSAYTLTVIQCDAAVADVSKISDFEGEVPTKAKGRGGTSFVPPFVYLREHPEIKVPWLVYFTDGYGNYPEWIPEYPVIWVMTTEQKPPFGSCIKMRLSEVVPANA